MISEEKLIHIIHLMLDGLEKEKLVTYPDKVAAVRELKRVGLQWLSNLNAVSDVAAQRIRTQRNAPLENSPQWDVLFAKYCEEEMAKRGG